MIKKVALASLLAIALSSAAAADDGFRVQHIQVNGLKRIPLKTLYSYLPIKLGDQVNAQTSTAIIQDLYKSGFFSNIALTRQGDTLNINVVERPVVGDLNIHGNKAIKKADLLKALKGAGIATGLEFNPSTLDEIKNVLLQQYFSQSKYGVKVSANVQTLSPGRVGLNIDISEGKAAKVEQVTVVGNTVFKESELLKQFKLSPPNLFSFFTHNDLYTSEKLQSDLNSLRSFYLDHGYLQYQLNNSQVSITPALDQIYVTADITEGPQYSVSGYKFSGSTILSQEVLDGFVPFKVGDVFSRQQVIGVEKSITDKLGDKGYARANVQVVPNVNQSTHKVGLNFDVQPGQRIYVRHISFSGNYQTNDTVLRRAVEQYEGALVSTTQLQASKQDLLQLPFVSSADMTVSPVANASNEEDVNYKVAEHPAASFNAGIGYSDTDKFLFQMALNQKSFLGTGNSLNLQFSRSASTTSYNIDYFNPYYTIWGVGREISLNYTRYKAGQVNIANYATNNMGAAVNYSLPISHNLSYQLGVGYNNSVLIKGSAPPQFIRHFTDKYGTRYYDLALNTGLTYSNYDRAIMPTSGTTQSLGLTATTPAGADALRYYQGNYSFNGYVPLYKHKWVFNGDANLGYANGYGKYSSNYPFFKNFFAGGMGSVRGYESNTLGPKDGNGDPIGGNILMTGSLGLIFPNPISHNVRTSLFVDGGNVYDSNGAGHNLGVDGVELNKLRYSTGMEVDWLSPMGVTLQFALAKALNPGNHSKTQFFGFNITAGV
jgi:outer membrane protein insertion porin family